MGLITAEGAKVGGLWLRSFPTRVGGVKKRPATIPHEVETIAPQGVHQWPKRGRADRRSVASSAARASRLPVRAKGLSPRCQRTLTQAALGCKYAHEAATALTLFRASLGEGGCA